MDMKLVLPIQTHWIETHQHVQHLPSIFNFSLSPPRYANDQASWLEGRLSQHGNMVPVELEIPCAILPTMLVFPTPPDRCSAHACAIAFTRRFLLYGTDTSGET